MPPSVLSSMALVPVALRKSRLYRVTVAAYLLLKENRRLKELQDKLDTEELNIFVSSLSEWWQINRDASGHVPDMKDYVEFKEFCGDSGAVVAAFDEWYADIGKLGAPKNASGSYSPTLIQSRLDAPSAATDTSMSCEGMAVAHYCFKCCTSHNIMFYATH